MQNNNTGQVKKTKSKTTLLHKFVDKFTKKKKRSKNIAPATNKESSHSRERTSENSRGKRLSRSPSRSKVPPATTSHPRREKDKPERTLEEKTPKYDMNEVTAKGVRSKDKEPKQVEKEKKAVIKKAGNLSPVALHPIKSPSMVMIAVKESQMDTVIHSQKVEKAIKAWLEILEKSDHKKVLTTDFKPIDHFKVSQDKCTAFKKNLDMCQSENSEVLDANRVKAAGEADFFYHGSVLTIPNVTAKVVLAQLPLSDDQQCLENFWLMVASHKIQRVFVICGETEIDKKAMGDYFPEDFVEHKTIRVNNRKTSHKSDEQLNDMLYYEVVPKDCAEAPFAMMEICDFWSDGKIPIVNPNRPAITAGCVFESDIDPDASIGIVSMFGAGRAGSFLVGALAIDKLRAGEAPVIKDLAMTVRTQRPGAIETLPQYTYCHIIALTYSLKYITNATMKARIEKQIGVLEQFACEKLAEEEEEDSTADN